MTIDRCADILERTVSDRTGLHVLTRGGAVLSDKCIHLGHAGMHSDPALFVVSVGVAIHNQKLRLVGHGLDAGDHLGVGLGMGERGGGGGGKGFDNLIEKKIQAQFVMIGR